jgi:hypothetical protein
LSDRSLYVFPCRCSGCINRWDVLINRAQNTSKILKTNMQKLTYYKFQRSENNSKNVFFSFFTFQRYIIC